MARLGRRKLAEVGPRSAHVAGLPYACFAARGARRAPRLELVAPRAGDPEAYAVVAAAGRRVRADRDLRRERARRSSPTTRTPPGRARRRSPRSRRSAQRLRSDAEDAARALLDGAVEKIADAVAEAARQHDLGRDVPLVALGGAGAALVPEVARRARARRGPARAPRGPLLDRRRAVARARRGRRATRPSDGASGSRSPTRPSAPASTPAPRRATVAVETAYDAERRPAARRRDRRRRARGRRRRARARRRRGARSRGGRARRSGIEAEALAARRRQRLLPRLLRERLRPRRRRRPPRRRRARRGRAARRRRRAAPSCVERAPPARSTAATRNLGVATLLPRVALVCGSRILDLSDARRAEDIVAAAARALDEPQRPGRRASSPLMSLYREARSGRRRLGLLSSRGRARRSRSSLGFALGAPGPEPSLEERSSRCRTTSAGARRARAGPDPLRVAEPATTYAARGDQLERTHGRVRRRRATTSRARPRRDASGRDGPERGRRDRRAPASRRPSCEPPSREPSSSPGAARPARVRPMAQVTATRSTSTSRRSTSSPSRSASTGRAAARPTLASRVAEMLGVSRASAGEMLKRLEAEGLIERGEHKEALLTDDRAASAPSASSASTGSSSGS